MKRVSKILVALGALTLCAEGVAVAEPSIGNDFPIREPGTKKPAKKGSSKKKRGPYEIIVNVNGRGPYTTISQALKDVAEGGEIFVREGVYYETLTINKAVTIQGHEKPGSGVEVVAPANAHCLHVSPKEATTSAAVSNIRFRSSGDGSAACVNIMRGVFTLSESDVRGSASAPAVRVAGGNVMLRKNSISEGRAGVYIEQISDRMTTSLSGNKIFENKIGVDIAPGSRADVELTANDISDNAGVGINSSGFGEAAVIGNIIRANGGAGIVLNEFSTMALVRYNEVVQNSGAGIAIPTRANGVIESNDIICNSSPIATSRGFAAPWISSNYTECERGKKRRGDSRRNSAIPEGRKFQEYNAYDSNASLDGWRKD